MCGRWDKGGIRGMLSGTKTMITILNNSIQGILILERDIKWGIKQSQVLIGRAD